MEPRRISLRLWSVTWKKSVTYMLWRFQGWPASMARGLPRAGWNAQKAAYRQCMQREKHVVWVLSGTMRMKPYLSLAIIFTSGWRNNTRYAATGLPSLSMVPYEHVNYVVLMFLFISVGIPKLFPTAFPPSSQSFRRAGRVIRT